MVKGVNKQIVLTAVYDNVFGVFNHAKLGKSKPMASVAMHEIEDVNNNDALRSAMLNYIRNDIKELFGLSFLEYINLPSFIMRELHDTAVIAKKEKAETINDITSSLNKP